MERVIFQGAYYGAKIESRVVVGETPHYYLIKPNHPGAKPYREKKIDSGRRAQCATWEEAHKNMIKSAEEAVEICKRDLQVARSELGSIQSMKKPEGM